MRSTWRRRNPCTSRSAPTPETGDRPGDIRGSTTIVEILRMYPNGEAGRLMSQLAWPCAHCGGAFREPLTLAAKRHGNDPRAALTAFRALALGGPTPEQIVEARRKVPR